MCNGSNPDHPKFPMLPKPKSFIEQYCEYASDLTDTPLIYHDALAYTLLSIVVGRKPLLITPRPIYPNLCVVLVGCSGFTRKTTAMNIGLSLILELDLDVKKLSNDFTPEGLLSELQEVGGKGIVVRGEIGGLLASIKKRDYMAGTSDLFCELYDCPSRYRRKVKSSSINIDDVYFGLLGSTTPSRLQETLTKEDFEQGLGRRTLLVTGVKEKRIPRRNLTINDHQDMSYLKDKLEKLAIFFKSPKISFILSDKALVKFNEWEEKMESNIGEEENSDVFGSIYVGLSDYVLKIAVLEEVSKIDPSSPNSLIHQFTVSFDSLITSIHFVEELIKGIREVVNFGNRSKTSKIMLLLKKLGGSTDRSALLKKLKLPAADLTKEIQSHIDKGEIIAKEIGEGKNRTIIYSEANET